MKTIAILGSGEACVLSAILEYFKDKNVKIHCFSDNLKSDFFASADKSGSGCKYLPYEETAEIFDVSNFDLIVLTDYAHDLSGKILNSGRFINIHPSLLPAFKGKDAISRAFASGVKVSGVTVQMLSTEPDGGKIIAQYPVLIGNLMHFDEFKNTIYELERALYPIVIEKVLKDEVFDFHDLLSAGCSGCCKII